MGNIEVVSSKANTSSKPPQKDFRHLLLISFLGSLAANVLLLTFFCIPFGIAWHFALLWLCIAWSVLGTGSLVYRTAAALIVWAAGAVLLIGPYLFFRESTRFVVPLAPSLLVFTIPNFVVFWSYGMLCGRFRKLEPGQIRSTISDGSGNASFSLLDLVKLMTLCAISVAAIRAVATFFFEVEDFALLALLASALLVPLIGIGCGFKKYSLKRAFNYLLILCGAIFVISTAIFVFAVGELGSGFVVIVIGLLAYFSTGAFIIFGLSILRGKGHRFGRSNRIKEDIP